MAGPVRTSNAKKSAAKTDTAKTGTTKTTALPKPAVGQTTGGPGDAKKRMVEAVRLLGRMQGLTNEMLASLDKRMAELLRLLRRCYPDATCSLNFHTPLELLVATILSAQCTDERVNIVTRDLFRKYCSAADYAQAPSAELEKDIQSTGFFRNKAKSIQNCCRLMVQQHGGQVPQSIEQLVALPGVGRKTANVILGTAFGIASGVVVDTHVTRLSRRLGLSQQKDAEKIEKDLMAAIPSKQWVAFSHRMIQHGRKICVARKPKCDVCPLSAICPKVGVELA